MQPGTSPNRQRAVEYARMMIEKQPVYIDTETTGLDRSDEIVEICIVDHDGQVLLESLIKPSRPIPPDSIRVHNITDEMVAGAPTWPALWPTVRANLFNRVVAAYNSDFDLRMMMQSHGRYRLPWRENFAMLDILKLFSDFRGEWDPMRRSMRYFRLQDAGSFFNIAIPNAHRAAADTLLARAVLHCIAGLPYS